MASEYEVGDVVWAKMKSYPWWPGMIGEPEKDAKKPAGKKPFQFVVFFGNNSYSWIAEEFIKPYRPHVEEYSKCNLASFKYAMKCVEESIVSSKGKSSKSKPETSKANGVSPEKRLHDTSKVLNSTKSSKRQKTDFQGKSTSEPQLSDESDASSSENDTINRSKYGSNTDRFLPLLSNLSPFLVGSSSFNDDDYDWSPKQQPTGLLNRPVAEPLSTDTSDMGNISKPAEDFAPPSTLKIGFLGLGTMGTGIARHLVNAGLHVTVWNRSPKATKRFEEAGVAVGKTAADVVLASDVIFSCVSDSTAAKEIVFGIYGVLEAIKSGQGYVEITSIDHKTSKDIESAIHDKGGLYLEAPIIGSRELCVTGQLVVIAAGDSLLFDRCRKLFEIFAKQAYYLGGVGNASNMSILMNMLVGTSLASFAESMSLAERVNVSQQNLLDIVKLGPLRCPLFIEKAKAIMNRDFTPSIRLQHVQKDLQFALQLGHEYVQPLPLTAAANEVFKHAKCLGYADHDVSAVYNARY